MRRRNYPFGDSSDEACDDEGGAGAEEVKEALRKHGGKHSLFYAVEKDMPEMVAKLIEEGADAALTNGVRACTYVKA